MKANIHRALTSSPHLLSRTEDVLKDQPQNHIFSCQDLYCRQYRYFLLDAETKIFHKHEKQSSYH